MTYRSISSLPFAFPEECKEVLNFHLNHLMLLMLVLFYIHVWSKQILCIINCRKYAPVIVSQRLGNNLNSSAFVQSLFSW